MRPRVISTCAVLIMAGAITLVCATARKPAAQPAMPGERAVSQSRTVSNEERRKAPESRPNGGTAQAATSATASGTPVASGGVPLVLKLPQKMFIGTPPELKLAGIEVTTQRAPLMVPANVKLISLGKPVTASDNAPVIGELPFITDGEKSGMDGCFVELAPMPQWVQIDLNEPSEVYAIAMWHYHAQARVYHDVIVRCADDLDFTSGGKTLFNNDSDNSAGLGIGKNKEYLEDNQGKLFDLRAVNSGQPVKTRYLRFYSNGNTANEMNHYIEIEVYGRAVTK